MKLEESWKAQLSSRQHRLKLMLDDIAQNRRWVQTILKHLTDIDLIVNS